MSWYRGPVYDGLGLDWRSHRIAFWCFRKLWLQPLQLVEYLKTVPASRRMSASTILLLHNLPYIAALLAVYSMVFEYWMPWDSRVTRDFYRSAASPGSWLSYWRLVYSSMFLGGIGALIRSLIAALREKQHAPMIFVASLLAYWPIVSFDRSAFPQLHCAVLLAAVLGVAAGLTLGRPAIAPFAVFGLLFGPMPYGLMLTFDAPTARLLGWLLVSPMALIAYHAPVWILHPFFVWPRVRGEWYWRHPLAWDDMTPLFPGVRRLLEAFAERYPESVPAEFDRLCACRTSASDLGRQRSVEAFMQRNQILLKGPVEPNRLCEWLGEISKKIAKR